MYNWNALLRKVICIGDLSSGNMETVRLSTLLVHFNVAQEENLRWDINSLSFSMPGLSWLDLGYVNGLGKGEK